MNLIQAQFRPIQKIALAETCFLKNVTFGTVPWERKHHKETKECCVAGAKLAVLSCTSKSCDKIVSCSILSEAFSFNQLAIMILFNLEIYDLSINCINCRRFLKIKFPIAFFEAPVFVTVFWPCFLSASRVLFVPLFVTWKNAGCVNLNCRLLKSCFILFHCKRFNPLHSRAEGQGKRRERNKLETISLTNDHVTTNFKRNVTSCRRFNKTFTIFIRCYKHNE